MKTKSNKAKFVGPRDFINLLPVTLRIEDETGVLELPSKGWAKIADRQRPLFEAQAPNGTMALFRTTEYLVEGLPAAKPGVLYIVDKRLAKKVGRSDVLTPTPEVTDETHSALLARVGEPFACTSFTSYTMEFR